MLILRLAWRSFRRHKRRSIITVSAVSISLAMMIIFVGIGDDGHARMAELGIRLGAGHVLIQGKGYQVEQTLDHLVAHPRRVIAAAQSLPQVTYAVPRVRASGLLTSGGTSAPVMVSGVDPRLEPKVSDIPSARRRIKGHYLRTREQMRFANQPADIYIGEELAKTLELTVGDRTVLTISPRHTSRPASAAFVVRGIFRTGIDELDSAYIEIPLVESQKLLNLGKQVVQVAVHLNQLDKADHIAQLLHGQLPSALEVLSWKVALKELHDAIVLDDAGLYLMMAIIFIIVTIGIFNTVLMSVVERTREFGVMMAVGTRPTLLFNTVFCEVVLLALVAAAVGVAIGLGLHFWVASTGIDMTSYAKDYEISGVIMEGRIYSKLSTWVVAKWTLVVIGLTLASALYPAIRAARLRPLEAIHHV